MLPSFQGTLFMWMLLAMLQVFNIIPHRDVALWDAIISAYAMRGHAILPW